MKTNAVKVKPISAFDVIIEEKFIREIRASLYSKLDSNSIQKNEVALSMLKKARFR